jgi:hypothetical protein
VRDYVVVGLTLVAVLLAIGCVMSDTGSAARCAVVFCRADEQWSSRFLMPDPIPGLRR